MKAGLFAGLVGAIGAGVMRRIVLAEPLDADLAARLRWATWAGAAALLVLGPLDLWVTLRNVLGTVGGEIFLDYAASTSHGRLTLARAVLVVALGVLASAPVARGGPGSGFGRAIFGAAGTAAWAVASVAVLYTVSAASHASAAPERAAVPMDVAHLVAACAWVGAVGGVAFLPLWGAERRGLLLRTVGRVSTIGLLAVTLLFATGLYAATLHVGEPSSLATSRYGLALVTKVALVVVIVAIAGLNRFRLLPALRDGSGEGLRRAMRIEAFLLAGVLAATAVVATSAPPH